MRVERRAGGSRGRPAGAPKGVLQVAWERHSPTRQEKEPRSFAQSSPLGSDADPHQRCSSLQTQPRGDGGHPPASALLGNPQKGLLGGEEPSFKVLCVGAEAGKRR